MKPNNITLIKWNIEKDGRRNQTGIKRFFVFLRVVMGKMVTSRVPFVGV